MKMANGFSSSGREKGKDKGTGKKGVCSNCGEIYHHNRDCPTDKQHSSWWNNQKGGKAGKDRGTWLDTGRNNFLTVERSARAKETNGTGMASDKGGRVLSGRTFGVRQCGNTKAA